MAENIRLKLAKVTPNMSTNVLVIKRQIFNVIEGEDYNPTIRLYLRICKLLGRNLDELFWEDNDK